MNSRVVFSLTQSILAFVGTAIAGTLYWAHTHEVDLPCTSGNGCELVGTSHWAFVHGVPVSLVGACGYIVLLFASVLKLTTDSRHVESVVRFIMVVMTAAGTAYSWYLQWVADYFIGAFCIYCRASAITMTVLFAAVIAELVMGALASRRSGSASANVSA